MYSSYVPWIQAMLTQHIPDSAWRDKYWMEQVPLSTDEGRRKVCTGEQQIEIVQGSGSGGGGGGRGGELGDHDTDNATGCTASATVTSHKPTNVMQHVRIAWTEEKHDGDDDHRTNVAENTALPNSHDEHTSVVIVSRHRSSSTRTTSQYCIII